MGRVPDLEINLVDNPSPAIDKYRDMSEKKAALLQEYMANLLKGGVIEKKSGSSQYCANPHVIRERRGTAEGYIYKFRYTIDARSQNQLVKNMSYKMPLMQDLLKKASIEGKFFTCFDLCTYFFQLPLAEKSRDITTF